MTRKYGVFGKKGVRAAASGFESHRVARASGLKASSSGRTRMKVHGHAPAAGHPVAGHRFAATAPAAAPAKELPAPPWCVESCPEACPTDDQSWATPVKRRFSGSKKARRRRNRR